MAAGPDFLCIGAQKAATGWLYEQLSWHPQVWVGPIKELHVFDSPPYLAPLRKAVSQLKRIDRVGLEQRNRERSANFRPPMTARDVELLRHYAKRGELDFDWYRGLFSAKGTSIAGELTPAYSGLPQAMVDRIALELPDVKIVFLVRDPVARAWSALQMRKSMMGDSLALDDIGAVRALLTDPRFQCRSYPTETIRRWTRAFPKGQFHYEFFDDIARSPQTVRRSIMEFLGADLALETDKIAANFNRKETLKKYELTRELRSLLIELFGEEVERCARELGGPALEWPNLYRAR
jgi:hypothetical protein